MYSKSIEDIIKSNNSNNKESKLSYDYVDEFAKKGILSVKDFKNYNNNEIVDLAKSICGSKSENDLVAIIKMLKREKEDYYKLPIKNGIEVIFILGIVILVVTIFNLILSEI